MGKRIEPWFHPTVIPDGCASGIPVFHPLVTMKFTTRPDRPAKGMTLLELTVVILVLLSLVAILFVGATAWKRGSDRSGCILHIRNAQSAVRAYQNVRGVDDGTTINMFSDIIGTDKYMSTDPQCPGGGDYDHIGHVPYPGELALTCDLAGSEQHVPLNSSDW
jgi:competence protein ComGC